MATPGMGYDSWVSFKEEVTYGVDPGGARDMYLRMIPNPGLHPNKNFQEFPGMSGPGVRGHFAGNTVHQGPVEPEFHYEGLGKLIKWVMGGYAFAVNTPEVGANTHTFSMSNNATLPSFSMEMSIGDIPSGDVFLYKGCVINQLALSWENQALVKFALDIIGKNEVADGAAVGAAVFPSDQPVLWHFVGTATIVGTAGVEMKSGGLTINNNMAARYLMSKETSEPLRANNRVVSGNFLAEFADLVLYNKYIAETTGTVSLAILSDTNIGATATKYTLTLTGTDGLLTAARTGFNGPGPIDLPLDYQLRSATAEATIALINGEATYA